MHANCGITFDLDAIRNSMPDIQVNRFTAIGGLSDTAYMSQKAELWVLLDGKLQDELHIEKDENAPEAGHNKRFSVEIKDTDRYLTLITTDGGDEFGGDWTLFGHPVLEIE